METWIEGNWLLLCDKCPKAYHTGCLETPLDAVPAGTWLCPGCAAPDCAPDYTPVAELLMPGEVVQGAEAGVAELVSAGQPPQMPAHYQETGDPHDPGGWECLLG